MKKVPMETIEQIGNVKWNENAILPSDRQNIGTILKEVGMSYYDEFPLLVYTSGCCCMDDFDLEEI